MTEIPSPDPSRSPLRALLDWMRGGSASPVGVPASRGDSGDVLPARIAHYAIIRKVGQGGMGVVYEARDERLHRTVAVKTMSLLANDEIAKQRFWREARAAASVNHPNVCQIYEIGDDNGALFIAMELLEGEALARRLQDGPLPVSAAVPIALAVLDALAALHARGIIHRDLKPSNVFLTPHGVKLLDFGLARPEPEATAAAPALTRTGLVLGTPRYMAPEQVAGEETGARADLFATGAILFEMLSGRPAFGGRSVMEVLQATLNEQPPALTGSPAVAAVDRVIRRALAKRPADRPASALVMAAELRAVRGTDSDDTPVLARALTRLVVLPFRVLRSDPDSDFLAYSLPDAIATSLSSVGTLVVRSSAVAARFAGETPDLRALAAEADVDRVVMGTLLRSGDQLRVAAQLVEAPGGTLITSHTAQASLGDLFRLQDDLARRVAEGLALPLTGVVPATKPDVPRDDRAYAHYLRANELARRFTGLIDARLLYERCLELDPLFAPAWAHLGRCHRVIGKFVAPNPSSEADAEEAFKRALALSPHLSIAHRFYANLEADIGQPARALVRLLAEAGRHANDPEPFAGLVHACRYCGLFDESLAAHDEARRLDPNVPTSIEQTLLMMGDVDRLLAIGPPAVPAGGDAGTRVIGLGLAGRHDEARQELAEFRGSAEIAAFQMWTAYLTAWLDRRPADMSIAVPALDGLTIQNDPEAIFLQGRMLCDVGEHRAGVKALQRAVAKGYVVAPTLAHAREFDALRGTPAFEAVLAEAEAGRRQALAAFKEAGGGRLLGTLVIKT